MIKTWLIVHRGLFVVLTFLELLPIRLGRVFRTFAFSSRQRERETVGERGSEDSIGLDTTMATKWHQPVVSKLPTHRRRTLWPDMIVICTGEYATMLLPKAALPSWCICVFCSSPTFLLGIASLVYLDNLCCRRFALNCFDNVEPAFREEAV